MSSLTVWDRLAMPFDPRDIKWRPGSVSQAKGTGLALAYIDARMIMERLDEVLGPENWSDDYKPAGSAVICKLSIRIKTEHGFEWISKSDGAGQTQVEGDKGGISDALKRAAVKFGIGRYLYYFKAGWYQLDPSNKWFVDAAIDKMTNDLGSWQREYFKAILEGNDDGELPARRGMAGGNNNHQPAQAQAQAKPGPSSSTTANNAEWESLIKQFQEALAFANSKRREEGIATIQPNDIMEQLEQLGFPRPAAIKNWNDLRSVGTQGVKALITDLRNQPTLVGSTIPF
jgi:hypothetical protein